MNTGTQKAIEAGRIIDVIIGDWSREVTRQRNMASAAIAAAPAGSSAARDLVRVVEINDAMLTLLDGFAQSFGPSKIVSEAVEPALAVAAE